MSSVAFATVPLRPGQAITGSQRFPAIRPDDELIWVKLSLSHSASQDPNVRLFLRAAWADGAGEHEETIDELGHVRGVAHSWPKRPKAGA